MFSISTSSGCSGSMEIIKKEGVVCKGNGFIRLLHYYTLHKHAFYLDGIYFVKETRFVTTATMFDNDSFAWPSSSGCRSRAVLLIGGKGSSFAGGTCIIFIFARVVTTTATTTAAAATIRMK